jgi:hypothetical protein
VQGGIGCRQLEREYLEREIENYDNGRDRGKELERQGGRRDIGGDNRVVCRDRETKVRNRHEEESFMTVVSGTSRGERKGTLFACMAMSCKRFFSRL